MPGFAIDPVYRVLKREFRRWHMPVVDLIQAQTRDPFKVLVSTILSARTKDETTAAASERLYRVVGRPADLARLSERAIDRLIYPVGFHRAKAHYLHTLPERLDALFGGRIPDTVEELVELPGVGRKTANLVVALGFAKPAICVDVHVHRISNRWGYISTRTPLESELDLRKILPHRHWQHYNSFLVAFGQNLCTPRRPRCGECPIHQHCQRVGL